MASALRHALYSAAFGLARAMGAGRALAPLSRGRGVILTFHHVRPWRERAFAPNRGLEITPEFLDATLRALKDHGFDLLSLDEVPERLAAEGGPPFAALTFDDGYRDNADHARPVLRRHGAPWTLFVTRDFAAGRGRLWWLELEEAVARLDRVRARLDEEVLELPARTPAEKVRAFEALYWRLRAGPEERLLAVIGGIASEAGVESSALVREHCMGWGEIAELAREGVGIGAHTLAHPMLAKHPEERARQEISESRRIIQQTVGVDVRHFSYPVGDPGSAGHREFRLAAEAGFTTAVTTRPGHLRPEHSGRLHALPRVSINGRHQTRAALDALLSGVAFLGRRAA